MERNEIIKALECCLTPKCSNCMECPARQSLTGTDCLGLVIGETIALIKELIEDNEAKDETITSLIKTIKECVPMAEPKGKTISIPKYVYKEEECPSCKHFAGCECFDGETCDLYEEGGTDVQNK